MSVSMSSNGVVDHHRRSSRVFTRNLTGFLGQKLGFFESEPCSENARSSKLHVIQKRRRSFLKKRRSTKRDPSSFDSSVFDGRFTADELSVAEGLLILKEQTFSPQITAKEEDLGSAVTRIPIPEFHSAEEKASERPAISSKIYPEKQRKRCQFEASVEGEERAEKRAKKQNPNPDLPMDFKIHIRELTGSEEAVFVYEKRLFRSDVNAGQNRFLIPCKQVKNDFLTEMEKKRLKTRDLITGKCSIEALLIEPSLEECKINIREWDMGGKSSGKVSENYVLVTTWNKVVRDNNLAEGMAVQLWSFRRGDELCFALINKEIERAC